MIEQDYQVDTQIKQIEQDYQLDTQIKKDYQLDTQIKPFLTNPEEFLLPMIFTK